MTHPMNSSTAICGLGITEMGRVYRGTEDFAIDAVYLALEESGLPKSELDGPITSSGVTDGLGMQLQSSLGLSELNVMTTMQAYGSTAGQMISYAAMAVNHGLANYICCVFADAPLKEGARTGALYASRRTDRANAMGSLSSIYGASGAIPMYALGAQRHMDLYGTTQEQFGAIAISQREWATMNPLATKREPLDMETYMDSPWVAEPFHVLDCCLVSNGGVAVIVTTAERAKDLKQPPVYIRGFSQGHNDANVAGKDTLVNGPAQRTGPRALSMADAQLSDVTQCQLYDCYTYTVLVTLEDYGFCAKGEGGAFVEDGNIRPGGKLPTNTGGGELSSYYMWGMTPVTEAVIQGRGQAQERQADNDLILVSGNGGLLSNHATLLLSKEAA